MTSSLSLQHRLPGAPPLSPHSLRVFAVATGHLKDVGALPLCSSPGDAWSTVTLSKSQPQLTDSSSHVTAYQFPGAANKMPQTTEIDGPGSGGWNQKSRCRWGGLLPGPLRDHDVDSQVLAGWVPATPLRCTQLSKPRMRQSLLWVEEGDQETELHAGVPRAARPAPALA